MDPRQILDAHWHLRVLLDLRHDPCSQLAVGFASEAVNSAEMACRFYTGSALNPTTMNWTVSLSSRP
jgi:hypothetical protein